MFTWAQPGSGMFKLISAYNSAVKRNPNRQELSANPRKSSCYSSQIQHSQGLKLKYLKYSLNEDVESKFQGQQQGKGFFSLLLFFLIQVEGAAQECSSGSESRHPDGRQMLENISEHHVHFRRGRSCEYTQTLSQSLHTRGDRK